MKTFKLLAVALAAALLLLSCYGVSTQTTGKLEFALSSGGRSITAGSNLLRVSLVSVKSVGGNWLLQSLHTFPGGSGYAQGSVGGTLTLSNIPVGNWAVLVSAGTTDASGNFVTTDYNWPYPVVSVAAGVDNPVSVTLQPSPITPTSIFGTNAPGVVNVGGTIYSATGGQLYTVSGTTASAISGVTAPAGVHTNSLSWGWANGPTGGVVQSVFINTTQGIYYYNGSPSALSDLAASNPISILLSAAFEDSTSNLQPVILEANSAGFGGIYVSSTPYTSSMWVNVNLSSQAGINPIYDLTTTQNTQTFGASYAYLASKIGAFQISSSIVTAGSANAGNMAKANFFTVPDGSAILSLNALGNSNGGGNLYIGSTSGGWSATLTESNTAPQTSSPISGQTKVAATQGDSIVKIASANVGSVAPLYLVAFLSQYVLYLYNPQTANVKTYPFSAGLPGAISGLAWSATGPTLYISGRSGPTGTPGLVSLSGTALP